MVICESNVVRIGHMWYFLSKVEIKDCNILTDDWNFFDKPVESDIKAYHKIKKVATGQGDDYTTSCVLDYLCVKENYNLIRIDLSKQQAPDLWRKTKRNYFINLNIKDITDSKH